MAGVGLIVMAFPALAAYDEADFERGVRVDRRADDEPLAAVSGP